MIDHPNPINPIPNPIDKDLIEKILQLKLGFMQYFNIIGFFVTMLATYIFTTQDSMVENTETIKENKKENNNKPIGVTS